MIRLASNSDVITLRRAWAQEQSGTPGAADPAFETRLRQWLDQTSAFRVTWAARLEGAPVGMVSVRRYDRMPMPGRPPGAWGYLGQLYVLPEHRGNGIGRALVDTVSAHADEQGWYRLVLSPTEGARPLYARAGFGSADALLTRDVGGTQGSGLAQIHPVPGAHADA